MITFEQIEEQSLIINSVARRLMCEHGVSGDKALDLAKAAAMTVAISKAAESKSPQWLDENGENTFVCLGDPDPDPEPPTESCVGSCPCSGVGSGSDLDDREEWTKEDEFSLYYSNII